MQMDKEEMQVLYEMYAVPMGLHPMFNATHPFKSMENGYEYHTSPLLFNLQQHTGSFKDNKKREKGEFHFYIGDVVAGKCKYDNKTHMGYIINILYNNEESYEMPEIVYIIDNATSERLPLLASTLKKVLY